MERLYQFPRDATHFYCFDKDVAIKNHPVYKAAKAGDPEAALLLVTELAYGYLRSLEGHFPKGAKYVAPYAAEATGDNATPLLLSIIAAQELGGSNETDIVQMQKLFHTGADPMERLMLRPTFEGQVEAGRQYVLVDDVANMGGTLAELANFIRIHGGRVIGSIILVNAGRTKNFTPQRKHIRLLEERFEMESQTSSGYTPRSLRRRNE